MTKLNKRLEYGRHSLNKTDLKTHPIEQLKLWWQDALNAEVPDMNALTLSTVDADGHPDARTVLLQAFDEVGLEFFTNYDSAKARQLENNPYAAMTVYWPSFERQVRIRGEVLRSSRAHSQDYFQRRPRGAQISAWTSKQSRVISSRDELEKIYEEVKARFLNQEIPCPEHWGGFYLVPNYFEFWQGRSNRLHDRFSYTSNNQGAWIIDRLAP